MKEYLLYVISDDRSPVDMSIESRIEEAIKGGARIIQYRDKTLSYEEKLRNAIAIKAVCKKYEALLIINDSPFICREAGANGVHLGQDDMDICEARELLGKEAIIGATVHNVTEAKKAILQGADYLGCGAVFSTETKQNTIALSRYELIINFKIIPVPVFSIGGIKLDNLHELKKTGISGVAVVGAVFNNTDIKEATRALIKRLENMDFKISEA